MTRCGWFFTTDFAVLGVGTSLVFHPVCRLAVSHPVHRAGPRRRHRRHPPSRARGDAAGDVRLSTAMRYDLFFLWHLEERRADLAFDPVGGPLLRELIKSVRERGSVVSIGFAGGAEACLDLAEIVVHEKRLLGYDAWLETDEAVSNAFSVIRSFVEKGAVRPVIDSAWALDEFEKAYTRLASRQAMGTILIRP